jgi:hypothetical protein
MFLDLSCSTWLLIFLRNQLKKKKLPLQLSRRLTITLCLLYTFAVVGAIAGSASENNYVDNMDGIMSSLINVYFVISLQVLLEIKKVANLALGNEPTTVGHGIPSNNSTNKV